MVFTVPLSNHRAAGALVICLRLMINVNDADVSPAASDIFAVWLQQVYHVCAADSFVGRGGASRPGSHTVACYYR